MCIFLPGIWIDIRKQEGQCVQQMHENDTYVVLYMLYFSDMATGASMTLTKAVVLNESTESTHIFVAEWIINDDFCLLFPSWSAWT